MWNYYFNNLSGSNFSTPSYSSMPRLKTWRYISDKRTPVTRDKTFSFSRCSGFISKFIFMLLFMVLGGASPCKKGVASPEKKKVNHWKRFLCPRPTPTRQRVGVSHQSTANHLVPQTSANCSLCCRQCIGQ